MADNNKYKQFINCMQNLDCNVDNLPNGRVGKALPDKLLKNVCGGKLGFSRVKDKPEFSRQDFYRLAQH